MFKKIFNLTLLLSTASVLVACGEAEESVDSASAPKAEGVAAISPKVLEAWPLVEVKLVDDLDEPRGYCLDVAGGKGTNAVIGKGLQAHTCYGYTGNFLEDQSFDLTLLENGTFFINYFNVCMTAESLNQGVGVVLEKCAGSSKQKFSLESNGNIITALRKNLCVTVNGAEKQEGKGGSPVHVMRSLSLESCSDDLAAYQTWAVNKLTK